VQASTPLGICILGDQNDTCKKNAYTSCVVVFLFMSGIAHSVSFGHLGDCSQRLFMLFTVSQIPSLRLRIKPKRSLKGFVLLQWKSECFPRFPSDVNELQRDLAE